MTNQIAENSELAAEDASVLEARMRDDSDIPYSEEQRVGDGEGVGGRMPVRFTLRHPFAEVPKYATDGSGCFDLFSPHDGRIHPRGSRQVDTGVAFEIPRGYTMLVFGRSGHGINRDVRLANCVGVIDSDYRGTVQVKLTSDNSYDAFEFAAGDRIAQAMIIPTPAIDLVQVEELSETVRGDGGLGSTGA